MPAAAVARVTGRVGAVDLVVAVLVAEDSAVAVVVLAAASAAGAALAAAAPVVVGDASCSFGQEWEQRDCYGEDSSAASTQRTD